jgi:uncharacterized protein (TIGR02588 family)
MSPTTDKTERPSTLSRNVALASAAVIAVLVGYLTVEALKDAAPAAITVEIVERGRWTEGSSDYIPVDVLNTGGSMAADVEIETVFEAPASEPIVKRTSLDFLAAGERQRFYAVGPREGSLSVRVIGFQEP